MDLRGVYLHFDRRSPAAKRSPGGLGQVNPEVAERLFDSVSEVGGQAVDEAKGSGAVSEAKRTGLLRSTEHEVTLSAEGRELRLRQSSEETGEGVTGEGVAGVVHFVTPKGLRGLVVLSQ